MNSQRGEMTEPSLSNPLNMAFDTEEISLYDIVSPLLKQWRMLLLAAVLGFLAGLFGWWLKGSTFELKALPITPLNFVEWRKISSGLPALAEERRQRTDNDPYKTSLYATLSQPEWWSNNVLPRYRFSKSDLKELVAISKDAQEGGATIVETVVFRATSRDSTEAALFLRGAEEFVREGGLFLALKSSLSSFDARERNISAELRANASKGLLELTYLKKRASAFDALIQNSPEKSGASTQTVLDPKDNSAKYLPLGTQLVAVKTEIHAIEEALDRSRDLLEESQVTRAFLDKALPLLKECVNGFDLSDKINGIAAEISRGIDPANKPRTAAIDQIIFEFGSTGERYKTIFEDNTLISTHRAGKSLPMGLGLVGGLLSGVLVVLLGNMWRRTKGERCQFGDRKQRSCHNVYFSGGVD